MRCCNHCGMLIDDHSAFCSECGAPQNTQEGVEGARQQAYGGAGFNDASYGQQAYSGQEGYQQGNGQAFGGTQPYGRQAYARQPYGEQAYGGQGYHSGGAVVCGRDRHIAICLLFTLLTCGLYTLYWMVCLNDDLNGMSQEPRPVSGLVVLLLTFVTCGLYGLYWYYKMGNAVDRIRGTSNSGILYLVLSFVGVGVISLAMMQDAINAEVRPQ